MAYAITQLKAIGARDQSVTDWGHDRSGFEVRRYDFALNDAGTRYIQGLARQSHLLWERIQKAVRAYNDLGDRDYISLSIAAKTYFLIGHKQAPATDEDLAGLASKFGWTVSREQVRDPVDYLVNFGCLTQTTMQFTGSILGLQAISE